MSAGFYGRLGAGLRTALVFTCLLAAVPPASAQSASDLAEQRQSAERAHLWRVGAWGAANVAAGGILLATSGDAAQRRAFGIQSAAWGAVNVGIAAVALSQSADPAGMGLAEALRAENGLGDVLWLNMGLNAGYMAVGATLWIVSSRGVSNPAAWRGHGQAVLLQGAALLVLDGIVLAGSRGRTGTLIDLTQTAGPGVSVVIGL